MSFLEPVRGLVWEIVAGTVVAYAVPWLSEFVQRKIPPLWERYWPVIYESILVPAYELISSAITSFLSDYQPNHADSPAVSVSESPAEGTTPLDENTLGLPPDPVWPAVTDGSNGLPSDPEDITAASVSESITPLDGGLTAENNFVGWAIDPILNPTSSISSNPENITVIAVSESATLIEAERPPHIDQKVLGQALEQILDPSSNLSSDHEDALGRAAPESDTLIRGGTPNILVPESDPILSITRNISSDHEDITGSSVSDSGTLVEGGASPHDQNILGRTSDVVLNPNSNISSDNEDITVISTSESPTQLEVCPPSREQLFGVDSGQSFLDHSLAVSTLQASADVDFFREYGEGSRYRIEEVIGKGSHGVVCSAYDTHLRKKVAIKKISDVFKHVSDATRSLREMKLLRLLRHPDIVEINHILLPPCRGDFKDIYIVFELTECDLHNAIIVNDGLTPEHCRFFLYQLLRGVKYIHTANVFHRDLNPKNILTIADCKIKIRHFSHALIDTPTAIFWTDYVAMRWYKAPELCGQFFSKYSSAIDIWSVGCIFAELLTGKPLFPGANSIHQLELITDLLGTPSAESIAKIKNEKARTSLSGMQKKRPIPFPHKFPNADPLALVLLKRMLAFDPEDRPSAKEALADPYFKELARVEREPFAQPATEAEFEFERLNVTKEDVRELIYREILEYHPKLLKKEHIEVVAEPSHSFSRRRRMLAKVASIAPIKMHPHPHL